MIKAIRLFFLMLCNKNFLSLVEKAQQGKLCEPAQLLSLLQRDGRFIDFIMEDIASYQDAQVGAVARTVHKGCRKALLDYMKFEPVRKEQEGEQATVEQGFDPSAIRLSGDIKGNPPFNGTLTHHGWRVADVQIPTITAKHDPSIITPAEIEISAG